MNIKSPLRLRPAFKDYLWGGRKLVTDFNKKCDMDKVAESWELSAHKDGSSVICGGSFDGMTLREFTEKYAKDVMGTNALAFDFFPVLIKFIDAKDNLSVQVHPDDEYALSHEGEYGKTEMWYILDCEEGAGLYYGFTHKIAKEEFLERIKNNTLLEVLKKVPVKKGDVFFIPSGTVHAIGAGIVICEIQQNSNTTYRVYDYARRDKNGNTRELHIDKAARVSNLEPAPAQKTFADPDTLAECKYFTVKKAEVTSASKFHVTDKSFLSVIVTDGSGELELNGEKLSLLKGDSIFVPAQNADVNVTGKCSLILTTV